MTRLPSGPAVLIVALVTLFAVGCGEENDGGGEEAQTVTLTETVEEPAPAEEPQSEEPPPADESSDDAGGDIRVPDVVGEDHQLAQDTMQSAGLFNLAEEDATGQDRLLLYDRNWTVVEQDPAAGTLVSEDQTIVLRSKKDGE